MRSVFVMQFDIASALGYTTVPEHSSAVKSHNHDHSVTLHDHALYVDSSLEDKYSPSCRDEELANVKPVPPSDQTPNGKRRKLTNNGLTSVRCENCSRVFNANINNQGFIINLYIQIYILNFLFSIKYVLLFNV